MTEQQIFDKVWDHINAQGKPAMNSQGRCLYDDGEGNRCAVGCLLSDDMIRKLNEYVGGSIGLIDRVQSSGKIVPQADLELLTDHEDFLAKLQDIHDINSCFHDDFMRCWRNDMWNLACERKMKVPK